MRTIEVILGLIVLLFIIHFGYLIVRLLIEPSTRWPVIGLFSFILVLFVVFLYISRKIFLNKYNRQLSELDGSEWFIYTSKKSSQEFVEQNILPLMDHEIRVMKLKDGVTPWEDSEFGSILKPSFLYEIKRNRKSQGFPCLIKIMHGNIVDVSLHDELYDCISKKLPAERFLESVRKSLYQLREDFSIQKNTG